MSGGGGGGGGGLFGVVVPGRPVMTDFQPVNETKCSAILEDPCSCNELVFFLLPSTPIPPGYGAILYFSIAPFTEWELIGSIWPQKPSGVFRTGWATNESMVGCGMVQLGVALEPLQTIENLEIASSGVEDRFAFAHKIALDLFNFMVSFSTATQAGMMVVPTNVFDTWLERFERKYRQDPNFFLKS